MKRRLLAIALACIVWSGAASALSCRGSELLELYATIAREKNVSSRTIANSARMAVAHAINATEVIVEARFANKECLQDNIGKITFSEVRWLKGATQGHSATATANLYFWGENCQPEKPNGVQPHRIYSGVLEQPRAPRLDGRTSGDFAMGSCATELGALEHIMRANSEITSEHAEALKKEYSARIDELRRRAAAVAEAEAHPSMPAWKLFLEMIEARKSGAPKR